MQIILLIFKLLGFLIPEKKKFCIDDKWTIELPANWDTTSKEIELEVESDNHPIIETILFQPGSYLSIKAYYLDISKDGIYKKVEADIQDVVAVFKNIMSKVENKKEYKIPNHKSPKFKCYEYNYYENNEKVYGISCGIMVAGYLLIVNLYSALKEEVESAIKYIYSIEKVK